ncbi:MAG: hypothetical protein NTZ73_00190 [Candidatus Diapherotrites archaeon]|nr:hypothetical protein [Candidatus Diapherotrites archaeon]
MALGSIAQKIVDEHKERERQKMSQANPAAQQEEKAAEIIDGEKKFYSAKSGEIIDGETARMAEEISSDQQPKVNPAANELQKPSWERCKYFKKEGEREFCKQFMSLCVRDKCTPKIMRHIDDPELRKKYLKGEKKAQPSGI